MDEMLLKLQPIFQDVFDDTTLVITPESSAANVDGWDSLTHINLVTAIEQEFHIRFKLGELESLKNVGELLTLMRTKVAARP